jgi:hypothetical protein
MLKSQMKHLITLLFLLFYLPVRSQNFSYEGSEYMDTTTTRNPACAKAPLVYYFSVGGKYPRGSETLAAEATTFLRRKNQRYVGSGYVTFRFVVDCAGYRLPKTQVLQTDANYQATHFRKELVAELYAYLQTLKDWRAVTTSSGMQANYFTYLTFKISNGKVVAVIP